MNKKTTIALACITMIIIILIIVFMKISENKNNSSYIPSKSNTIEIIESLNGFEEIYSDVNYIEDEESIEESRAFKQVNNWDNLLDGISCIESFNYAMQNLYEMNNGIELDYCYDEDPATKIINCLDKGYIAENNINKDKINSFSGKYKYVPTSAYYLKKANYYFVTYGYLINKETKVVKDYGYLVKLNYIDQVFEITPYDGLESKGFGKIENGKTMDIQDEYVASRISNVFTLNKASENRIASFILDQFKSNALYKPEIAFTQLDKEYANKYGESSGFGTYIANNKDKLNKIYVAKIEKTTKEDDTIIFKCYDGERNVFYIQYSTSNYLDILIQFSNIML